MAIDQYTLVPNPFSQGDVLKVTMTYGLTKSFFCKKTYSRALHFQITKAMSTCKVSHIFGALQELFIQKGLSQMQDKNIKWERIRIENASKSENKIDFVKRLTGVYGARLESANAFESFSFAIYAPGLAAPRKILIKGVPSVYRTWDMPLVDPSKEALNEMPPNLESNGKENSKSGDGESMPQEKQGEEEQKEAQNQESPGVAVDTAELTDYRDQKALQDGLASSIEKAEGVLAKGVDNKYCGLKVVLFNEDEEPHIVSAVEGLGLQTIPPKGKKKEKLKKALPKKGMKTKKKSGQ